MYQRTLFKNWPNILQKQFFKEKNQVQLTDLAPESKKKVWWRCSKGPDHIWLEEVSKRYKNHEQGCPFCAGLKLSETNNLAKKYPKLAKEFLSQFNEGQIPNLFLPSSPKKIWWKCSNGEDHLWQDSIKNRVQQDKGCPFCKGDKVSVTNCLSSLHPEITEQWHPHKNLDLRPDRVKPDYNKKVWWQCPKGEDHEWQETVKTRVEQEKGCPFCLGNKVSETNCLETKFPKIAEQWHTEKNEEEPNQVLPTSKKRIWWQCPKNEDHIWQAPITDRVKTKKQDCPFCLGKLASKETSIVGLFPEIAEQWHIEKNEDILPEQYFPESSKKVWWKCEQGEDHQWETSIKYRTQKNADCPFCSGEKLSITNCFATLYPELSAQWHLSKNEGTAEDFFPQDPTVVWWKCEEGSDHEWEESILNRTENATCPFCSGERLSKMNSLAALYPKLAKEWHSKFNKSLKPTQFLPETDKLVWWQCEKNKKHEWMDSILKRVHGASCFDCDIIEEIKEKLKNNSEKF